jgi:succinate dehydrogenase / fumarate reductase membrane anchor subunit
MISRDPLRDPLAKARNWGSAKSGAEHFIWQRITAVMLALLTPWLVWLLITLIPADYVTARATLANPVHGVLMLTFLIALFWHLRMGLQVVIDDYVHNHNFNVATQLLVLFACSLGALASIVAVGRIVFSA